MELFDRELADKAGFKLDGAPITGGQSRVYRAYHSGTDSTVALKIYHDADPQHKALREVASLAMLDHPNIARFIGAGYLGKWPYVASQWIDGIRLSEFLSNNGPPGIEQAIRITHEIAIALDTAHKCNVIHGDVSPANILITPDNKVVLIDFGLGRPSTTSSITADANLTGTLRYLDPQIIKGASPGFASDQYALAILAYEMLSGCWPFDADGDSTTTQYANILHHQLFTEADPLIEHCPQISNQLDAVMTKALQKEPEQRFENIRSFDSAIKRALVNSDQGPEHTITDNCRRTSADRSCSALKCFFIAITAHWKSTIAALFISTLCVSTLAGSGADSGAGSGTMVGFDNTSNRSSGSEITQALQVSTINSLTPVSAEKNIQTNFLLTAAATSNCNLMPNPEFNAPLSNNFYKDRNKPEMVRIVNKPDTASSPLLSVGAAHQYGLYGQIIPIDQGKQFVFSALIFVTQGVEEAALSVSWLDQNWQLIENEKRVMRIENMNGTAVFDSISAPPNAYYAVPTVFKNASAGTLSVDNLIFSTSDNRC